MSEQKRDSPHREVAVTRRGLLGGKKLDFDWRKMTVTNVPDANQFIKPNYREGRSI